MPSTDLELHCPSKNTRSAQFLATSIAPLPAVDEIAVAWTRSRENFDVYASGAAVLADPPACSSRRLFGGNTSKECAKGALISARESFLPKLPDSPGSIEIETSSQ